MSPQWPRLWLWSVPVTNTIEKSLGGYMRWGNLYHLVLKRGAFGDMQVINGTFECYDHSCLSGLSVNVKAYLLHSQTCDNKCVASWSCRECFSVDGSFPAAGLNLCQILMFVKITQGDTTCTAKVIMSINVMALTQGLVLWSTSHR